MACTLFMQLRTNDFDAWLHPADRVAQMMEASGVQAYSLHRNLDDPNGIIVMHRFPDKATAETFVNFMGPALEARNDAGALEPESLTWWLGEDLPAYSSKS